MLSALFVLIAYAILIVVLFISPPKLAKWSKYEFYSNRG